MTDGLLLLLRMVGLLVSFAGMLLLAREQGVTVARGRPARPRVIVSWVAIAMLGVGIAVGSILVADQSAP